MPSITPHTAAQIVSHHPDASAVLTSSGTHRKYAYRFKLLNPNGRHLSIATKDSREPQDAGTRAGVTIYISGTSRKGERLPTTDLEHRFGAVTVTRFYPKGHVGSTGDKGLSSAAASCSTLDPYNHDVFRLSVGDVESFKRVLAWYAGEATASCA